jgi:hypothetical protein
MHEAVPVRSAQSSIFCMSRDGPPDHPANIGSSRGALARSAALALDWPYPKGCDSLTAAASRIVVGEVRAASEPKSYPDHQAIGGCMQRTAVFHTAPSFKS